MRIAVLAFATFFPLALVLILLLHSIRTHRSQATQQVSLQATRSASLSGAYSGTTGSWWLGLLSTLLPLAGTAVCSTCAGVASRNDFPFIGESTGRRGRRGVGSF